MPKGDNVLTRNRATRAALMRAKVCRILTSHSEQAEVLRGGGRTARVANRPYVHARGLTESKRATEPEGSSVTTSNRATGQSGHKLPE